MNAQSPEFGEEPQTETDSQDETKLRGAERLRMNDFMR